MEIHNDTGFTVGTLTSSIRQRNDAVAVIVKGAFDLVPGGACTPRTEQPGLSAEEPYPDGPGGLPRYPGDFVPFKPRTDLLVVGRCHAPEGRTLSSAVVAIGVGAWRKELAVFGDRQWTLDEQGGLRMSAPAPFASIPLRWDRAFGGNGYLRNPLGRGRNQEMGADGTLSFPLPNIEDPENLIGHPDAEPVPAGFGPLPADSLFRVQKQGTRDMAWVRRMSPVPPPDFDWSHYNAAPEDQQLATLRGDETLTFEGMHPVHRPLHAWLPGLRVQAFAEAAGDLREAAVALDTVWAEVDEGTLVLVWRALVPVAADALLLLASPLEGPAATVQDAAARLAILRSPPDDRSEAAEAAGILDEARGQLASLGLDPAAETAIARHADAAGFLNALGAALQARADRRTERETVREETAP